MYNAYILYQIHDEDIPLFRFRFSRLPFLAFTEDFFILVYRSSLVETGIFPQHPAPTFAVDENGGQLVGTISTNTYLF